MLLVLDASLINEIESSENNNAINALNLIAHSRRLGKHIVLGNRSVVKYLATCDFLSAQSRSVYRKIYEQLPITSGYINNIHLSIEIFSGSLLEVTDKENFRVIRVPVKYFTDFSILNKSVLLFEDMTDSDIYKIIVRYYLYRNNLGNIKIDYEPRNGGGQNTHKAFAEIQRSEQSFCLCLLDSDKKHAMAEIGSTAKSVVKINDNNKPFCDVLILKFREIENLIPTLMYKEIFESDINKKEAVNFLKRVDESDLSETRKYLDMKKGLNLEKVFKEKSQTDFREYWVEFAMGFHDRKFDKCLTEKKCLKDKSSVCNCNITLGFGDNILKEIEKRYADQDISHMISGELILEWERIGSIITAWCCIFSRMS
jgi:hypothetical protein